MDENSSNDVNTQTDTSTDGGSSPAEQTSAAEETTSETSQVQEVAENKTVPYERFSEINNNFRQTQDELRAIKEHLAQQQQNQTHQTAQQQVDPQVMEAKQQLKQLLQEVAPELGFVSKQEIKQQEAMKAVDTEHNRLAAKYSGADGLPKYDKQAVLDYAIQMGMQSEKGLEIAYKSMHEAEIMQARINKALTQTRGVQTETSNGTGSANTGVTDDDLKKAAQEGNKDATHLLLKRRLSGK